MTSLLMLLYPFNSGENSFIAVEYLQCVPCVLEEAHSEAFQ